MHRITPESSQAALAGVSPFQTADTAELRSPRPLRPEEGVLFDGGAVYTEIAPDTLAPETISPIRKTVPGLGKVALLERQEHRGHRHTDTERPDRWYSIELDGYAQGVRMTQADPTQTCGVKLVHLPGLTETIQDGPSDVFHTALARIFPELEVISIETDGVGDIGGKIPHRELWHHDLRTMAQQRLKLVRMMCGDSPVIFVATSMGSVLANQLLDMDLKNGQDLLASPLYFESAITPPDRVTRDMMMLFAPTMVADTAREVFNMGLREGWRSLAPLKRPPKRMARHIAPILRQIIDLQQGVPIERIERVTARYQSGVVSGRLDPLAQIGMWRDLRRRHPDLNVQFVQGKGHGMAANGNAAARLVASSLRSSHVIDRLLQQAA